MTLNGDWLPVSCTNAAAAAAHNDSEENCHKMTDDVVSRNCVQIHSVCVITLDPIMSESYISVRTSRCWLILFFFFLVALLWWLTRLGNSRRSVLFYFRYSLHYVCCRLFQLHIGRHLCHSRSYSYVSLLKRCSGWTQYCRHTAAYWTTVLHGLIGQRMAVFSFDDFITHIVSAIGVSRIFVL